MRSAESTVAWIAGNRHHLAVGVLLRTDRDGVIAVRPCRPLASFPSQVGLVAGAFIVVLVVPIVWPVSLILTVAVAGSGAVVRRRCHSEAARSHRRPRQSGRRTQGLRWTAPVVQGDSVASWSFC